MGSAGDMFTQFFQGAENLGSSALHGVESLGSSALHGLEGLGSSALHGVEGLFGGGSGANSVSGGSGSDFLNAGRPVDSVKPALSSVQPGAATSAASLSEALPNIQSADIGALASHPGAAEIAPNISPHLTGGSNPLQQILHGASDVTGKSNPLAALGSLGSLGLDIYKGTQEPAGVKALKALQGEQGALAKTFGQQVQGQQQGMLGAGGDALVQQGLDAEQAQIRSRYAQMGMTGSSAEQQDLAAAAQRSLAQRFQLGQQMASTGLNEVNAATGQQSALLQAIMQAETAQGTDFGQALSDFAYEASHGGP